MRGDSPPLHRARRRRRSRARRLHRASSLLIVPRELPRHRRPPSLLLFVVPSKSTSSSLTAPSSAAAARPGPGRGRGRGPAAASPPAPSARPGLLRRRFLRPAFNVRLHALGGRASPSRRFFARLVRGEFPPGEHLHGPDRAGGDGDGDVIFALPSRLSRGGLPALRLGRRGSLFGSLIAELIGRLVHDVQGLLRFERFRFGRRRLQLVPNRQRRFRFHGYRSATTGLPLSLRERAAGEGQKPKALHGWWCANSLPSGRGLAVRGRSRRRRWRRRNSQIARQLVPAGGRAGRRRPSRAWPPVGTRTAGAAAAATCAGWSVLAVHTSGVSADAAAFGSSGAGSAPRLLAKDAQ